MEFSFNRKYDFIDSCLILRMFLRDIPEQVKQVRRLFLSNQKFYVDDVAIMETVHVLTREHYDRTEIIDFLQTFLSNTMFVYNKTIFDPVFETYKTHPSLSLDDCVLAARAEQQKCRTLWTFDQKFAHQSKIAKLVPANKSQN